MATSVLREPAYLLHSRHYRESSLLVDVLTLNYGVLRLVVRGALRPSSSLKGLLQPFQPLLLAWQGRSELKNLTDVEISSRLPSFKGDYLYSGLYLNEMLTRLLPTNDPNPSLFAAYAETMGAMAEKAPLEPLLREFEFHMLQELGAFPSFTEEALSGAGIEPQAYYYWSPDEGFTRITESSRASHVLKGSQLIELSCGDFSHRETLLAAKRLSRLMIDHLLGGRPLKSRELIAKARELKKHGAND